MLQVLTLLSVHLGHSKCYFKLYYFKCYFNSEAFTGLKRVAANSCSQLVIFCLAFFVVGRGVQSSNCHCLRRREKVLNTTQEVLLKVSWHIRKCISYRPSFSLESWMLLHLCLKETKTKLTECEHYFLTCLHLRSKSCFSFWSLKLSNNEAMFSLGFALVQCRVIKRGLPLSPPTQYSHYDSCGIAEHMCSFFFLL